MPSLLFLLLLLLLKLLLLFNFWLSCRSLVLCCLQKKRRSIDRPVALAAPLLPFIKQNNGAGMKCTLPYRTFRDMTSMSRVWVWMWVGVPSLLSERILPRLDVPANDIRRILSHLMLSGMTHMP